MTSSEAVQSAAKRLIGAAESGRACEPVRDLIGRDDLAAAYAVQSEVLRYRLESGATVIGRKIGLTSKAVQAQVGVDQPDFGWLLDEMQYADGGTIPYAAVLQPRIEAEVAFVLRSDLADGPLDVAQVRGAIDHAVAALEICGSRVAGWDISFGDTVADNASSGVFVLGTQPHSLEEVEPRDVVMEMTMNGEVVSTGNGAACLGDPLEAVVWLARAARTFGEPLRAGQIVLSGALGPMRAVTPGATVSTTISGLGTVSTHFSE
jgi:2-keto-4-pentenoate hydratase